MLDTRRQAIADLQRVKARYSAAGPDLRPVFLRQLKDAQREYAKSSLTLLDFLDARHGETSAQEEENQAERKTE